MGIRGVRSILTRYPKLQVKMVVFLHIFFTLYNSLGQLENTWFMSLKGRSRCRNHTTLTQGCWLVLFFMLYMAATPMAQTPSGSWESVKNQQQGTLVVYYLVNEPFIHQDPKTQQLAGIEHDLLKGFAQYLQDQYQVSLNVSFKPAPSLAQLYNQIKNAPIDQALLGISSFSITPPRISEVGLTMPYCPDIEVLITNSAVPSVNNTQDFREIMGDFTAV
jgi:hypothetical protein